MTPKLKFAFFGTDEFATAVLRQLEKGGLRPALVVTAPDRPRGRGLKLTPPPVKVWSEERQIPCHQPEKLPGDEALVEQLRGCDLALVASYGKIIPPEIIAAPRRGCLNLHPSLLPKYRGATPLQTAILNGDAVTGVTLMLMDEALDHGPIIGMEKINLTNQNFPELRDELAATGARLFAAMARNWCDGAIKPVPQNHEAATYTKKITKADGETSLAEIAKAPDLVWRKFRAFTPWPGLYFFDRDQRVIIRQLDFTNGKIQLEQVRLENRP